MGREVKLTDRQKEVLLLMKNDNYLITGATYLWLTHPKLDDFPVSVVVVRNLKKKKLVEPIYKGCKVLVISKLGKTIEL